MTARRYLRDAFPLSSMPQSRPAPPVQIHAQKKVPRRTHATPCRRPTPKFLPLYATRSPLHAAESPLLCRKNDIPLKRHKDKPNTLDRT